MGVQKYYNLLREMQTADNTVTENEWFQNGQDFLEEMQQAPRYKVYIQGHAIPFVQGSRCHPFLKGGRDHKEEDAGA